MLFEILCFQQDTFFRRFMINDINKKKDNVSLITAKLRLYRDYTSYKRVSYFN